MALIIVDYYVTQFLPAALELSQIQKLSVALPQIGSHWELWPLCLGYGQAMFELDRGSSGYMLQEKISHGKDSQPYICGLD